MDKDKVILDLIKKVDELTLRVQQLETFEEENKILRQEEAELKVKIAELETRLNSNSDNSSRPPSKIVEEIVAHADESGAHILRELEGLVESGKSKWAGGFKTFLMSVYEMPFEERVKRRQHIEARYNLICSLDEKAEPSPYKTPGKKGKHKRTKGRNLVERLIREKDAVLAFAFNKEVPFTNNLTERDIRPVKLKLKISNCFLTFLGAEIYARIKGFILTTRKHNRNVFSELCTTFEGHNFIKG